MNSDIFPIYLKLKDLVLKESKIDPSGLLKALIRFIEIPNKMFRNDQVLQSVKHAFIVRSPRSGIHILGRFAMCVL